MLSKPAGKITRKVSVLTCRHFVEGGLPPNSCEYEMQMDASENSSSSDFFIHLIYGESASGESI